MQNGQNLKRPGDKLAFVFRQYLPKTREDLQKLTDLMFSLSSSVLVQTANTSDRGESKKLFQLKVTIYVKYPTR